MGDALSEPRRRCKRFIQIGSGYGRQRRERMRLLDLELRRGGILEVRRRICLGSSCFGKFASPRFHSIMIIVELDSAILLPCSSSNSVSNIAHNVPLRFEQLFRSAVAVTEWPTTGAELTVICCPSVYGFDAVFDDPEFGNKSGWRNVGVELKRMDAAWEIVLVKNIPSRRDIRVCVGMRQIYPVRPERLA